MDVVEELLARVTTPLPQLPAAVLVGALLAAAAVAVVDVVLELPAVVVVGALAAVVVAVVVVGVVERATGRMGVDQV